MTREAIYYGLSFFVMGSGICIVMGSLLYVLFNRGDK